MGQIRQNEPLSDVEAYILNALKQIKYGAVEIVVHDSRVVQVQTSEKTRFAPEKA